MVAPQFTIKVTAGLDSFLISSKSDSNLLSL